MSDNTKHDKNIWINDDELTWIETVTSFIDSTVLAFGAWFSSLHHDSSKVKLPYYIITYNFVLFDYVLWMAFSNY